MSSVEIIIGAILTIVVAALAERYEGRKKNALWACFVVLVVSLATVQIIRKRIEESERKTERTENKDDRDKFTSILDSGQKALAIIALEFKDTNAELKRIKGEPTDSAATQNAIANLSSRAQSAEQAARTLAALYEEQSKAENWPFGASGHDYPGLHEFFMRQFREANDLNGLDRFYLYQLMKNGGEIGRTEEDALPDVFKKEFGLSGSSGWSVYTKLENLGFIEEVTSRGAVTGFKLKEPYYSRFKQVKVP